MSAGAKRKLSELEGVSLGIIFKQQPCTAYHVRSELKAAPSSHWRASAGSVYPLLARLEEEGFISTAADENDGRGRKVLTVTPLGRNALKRWVVAGADLEFISAVTDPIRSRSFFLDVLGKQKRVEYVDRLIELTEDYLAETKGHLDEVSKSSDLYNYLGSLGAMKVTKTRLEWLREVRKQIA
jgi:DNA-binding PadR family transcriptional regulator